MITEQGTAATFYKVQVRVNLISAIESKIEFRVCIKAGERNMEASGKLLCRMRGGNRPLDVESLVYTSGKRVDEMSRSRARAQTNDHPIFNELCCCFSH